MMESDPQVMLKADKQEKLPVALEQVLDSNVYKKEILDSSQGLKKCLLLFRLIFGERDYKEFEELAALAAPAIVTNILEESETVVTFFFVGRLGSKAINAASLTFMFANCTGTAILFGLSGALDTQCTQAWGSNNRFKVSEHFQRACLILTLLCIPIMILWCTFTETVLIQLQIGGNYGEGRFASILSLGLWPSTIHHAAVKWLQAQGHFRPAVVVSSVTSFLNPLLLYLFIFKYNFGIYGAALTISILNWVRLFMLWFYVVRSKLHEATWRPIDSSTVVTKWYEFFRLGVPSMFMLCIEWWAWEFEVAMAGRTDEISLSAHSVANNLCLFSYVAGPMGFGAAVAIRVGQLVGGGNIENAKRCALVGLKACVAIMTFASLLLYTNRDSVGAMFTNDPEVQTITSRLFKIISLFLVLDGISVLLQGVMRGIGEQKVGAYGNFMAYYVIGMPVGATLCFSAGYGVHGIWIGSILGLFVADLVYAVHLLRTPWGANLNHNHDM
eukprot:m.6994 g.6994  ORF g.6994 m.6994 type:complete len:500 (-) comp3624_c0_seq1:3-1502(-)